MKNRILVIFFLLSFTGSFAQNSVAHKVTQINVHDGKTGDLFCDFLTFY